MDKCTNFGQESNYGARFDCEKATATTRKYAK